MCLVSKVAAFMILNQIICVFSVFELKNWVMLHRYFTNQEHFFSSSSKTPLCGLRSHTSQKRQVNTNTAQE